MSFAVMGKKVGMTRVFGEDGASIPVTAIVVESNVVTQVRTPERDGYSAVQVGYGDIKPRNSTMAIIGHDAKAGVDARRTHFEFRTDEAGAGEFEPGAEIPVSKFEGVMYVDVTGTSKGKGYAGGMKRHGFKGQLASHGVERKHRSPGSIGGHGNNAGKAGRIKKGKKMAGQMGNVQRTERSMQIVRIDENQNLLLVKGPVPGANGSTVMIKPAIRLNRSKANTAAQAAS